MPARLHGFCYEEESDAILAKSFEDRNTLSFPKIPSGLDSHLKTESLHH
jgi:hypothetical protein